MYKAYRTIIGELEPKPGNTFLPCYYAYHGDWKNYAKVQSDTVSSMERTCIRRGCYFYLEFARWCKDNMPVENDYIQSAVSAKLIMNNDSSYVRNDVYCIWFPELPSEETCQYLYEYHPQLKYQIARVCVLAKYNKLYKTIDVLTDGSLLRLCKEINPELYQYMNNNELYFVFDDTHGILNEPELLNKEIDFFNTEVIDNEDFCELYSDKESIHSNDYDEITEDLKVSDVVSDFMYYDPLMTNCITFKYVYQKIKHIEANLNQLSTFH